MSEPRVIIRKFCFRGGPMHHKVVAPECVFRLSIMEDARITCNDGVAQGHVYRLIGITDDIAFWEHVDA